ncbi:MAG TPA: HEAT repeat domain-containing protein [Vicinamibacterales bacterium]|nr:HEAT repeat domain-containing protein [Vicinamibacterales bacterium]
MSDGSLFSVLTSRFGFRFRFRFAAICMLIASPVLAQTPAVMNGTLETRAATQSIAREIASLMARTPGPAWVGYAVPVNGSDRESGCWSADGVNGRSRVAPLKLEGPDTVMVLYRISGKDVQQIRVASPECPLDAGGLTLHWLTGVRAADSVDYLETLAADGSRRIGNTAVMAIALHADTRATDRLIALARDNRNSNVRGTALFWVAQRAGDKAVGTLTLALEDPETDVRKKAVFALSQLPKDEGVPKLIEVASGHRDAAVRKQAMFWLGQSRDPRALAFFEQILRQ